jgi:hypothetical protein
MTSDMEGKTKAAGLRGSIERLLAGRAPTDPLCASNRTFRQKAAMAFWLLLPAAAVAAAFLYAANQRHAVNEETPAVREEPASPPVKIDVPPSNAVLDLESARVVRSSPPRLEGAARNKTGRRIGRAELVFQMTDEEGSNLGAVRVELKDIPPQGRAEFSVPLEDARAAEAVLREVR